MNSEKRSKEDLKKVIKDSIASLKMRDDFKELRYHGVIPTIEKYLEENNLGMVVSTYRENSGAVGEYSVYENVWMHSINIDGKPEQLGFLIGVDLEKLLEEEAENK